MRIVGSLLRSRPLEEKIDIVGEFRWRFWPQLESGVIAPHLCGASITEAEEAQRMLGDNENVGKVVLEAR